MILYVFDDRWHSTKGNRWGGSTAAKHPGRTVDEFCVEEKHTIATVAAFIKKRAGKRKIDLLRLCGHGNAGFLQIGEGLYDGTAAKLGPLRQIMRETAVVEIHGCGCASAEDLKKNAAGQFYGKWRENGKGHRFLALVAQTLMATVRGGVDEQLGDTKFEYENQWVEVSPTGKATVKGKAIAR